MKKTRVDAGLQRMFIQGLIASDDFLSGAAAHLDTSLLESPHLRLIADWCLTYFEVHKSAPRKEIEPLYYSWYEKQGEQSDESDAIKDLLGNMSDDYAAASDINVRYLLDELASYLTLRKLDVLREDLEDRVFRGDTEEGVLAVNSFRASTIGRGAGMAPLSDPDVWTQAFAEGSESLIEFPGAAGIFFKTALTREALVAIQAPEKRGKTWWCIELAMQALKQRRKVAFFEVGDLSEGQLLRRLAVRLTNRPMWQRDCGEISIPRELDEVVAEDGSKSVEIIRSSVKSFPTSISQDSIADGVARFHRMCGTAKETDHFMVSVHPTGSVRVSDIDAILTGWEVERGFVPDVVIIDYADILAPQNTSHDVRDQVNESWAAMRRMSQERRCLVLSPTQANAASYKANVQTMANFSNDKRKMAHVTAMLGLNQNDREKQLGIMRLNWIVLRESPFVASQCLTVAQCLTLGRVLCCSWMPGDKSK